MSKKIARMLVPALRFLEFRDAGEWTEKPLNQITTAIFDGTHQTPTYTEEGVPFFSVENIVSGKLNKFIARKDYLASTSKNTPEKGDVLITRIGNIGFSTVVDWDYEFSIYVTLAVVKKDDRYNSHYLHCFMQSGQYQTEIRSKSLLNAVPCKINMDELRKTKILLPSSKEQQKIADCLTSIDALISAQSQKVEALKSYKKGMMRQLFPREGKAIPRLRFAAFHSAGGWENSTLGNIATITSGGTPSRSKQEYWNGNIPWVTTSLIDFGIIQNANEFISAVGLKESSAKIFPKNTILMAMYGQGITRGKVAVLGIDAATNQACAAILLKKGLNTSFVFQNLASRYDEIRDLSNQGGQENLSGGLIEKISFSFPGSDVEQQKIAACLTSIDTLITAQTQKLEALKTHKKGLMQALFPAPAEVEA